VRRRWRLTVIVRAAHALGGELIQLGLEPIETIHSFPLGLLEIELDPRKYLLMISLDQLDNLLVLLLN
jgi:hypothetical protein